MREHMLISLIAIVGFYGLFTIYLDMRQPPPHTKWHMRKVSFQASDDLHHTVAKVPTLHVHIDSMSRMDIHISNFDPAESYFIDLGDGLRTRLASPMTTHHLLQTGDQVIKFFKNDELIDTSHFISIF
ncbi:MAG: hypothetical protein HKN87_16580 [Saprospiraceae bacterium]|nr:hypothetical protein [Saprospiraceae bacterium]